jgi:SAM-dependent methyltransferase
MKHGMGFSGRKNLLAVAGCLIAVLVAYPVWKSFANRNVWFLIAHNIASDSLRRIGLVSRQIGQPSVLHPPETRLPDDLLRTEQIYRSYLIYAGWDESQIAGKRVLELGPGFHIGVPLLFAAHGAGYVAGLDKFVPFQTGSYFRKFYSRLRDTLPDGEKAGFNNAIDLERMTLHPDKAGYIYRKDLPEAVSELGLGSFDLIASNAVIEEIYDPGPVFAAQDRLLRPGGVLVHKIDLRDYGMFTKHGFPALEFLTVPEWAYRRMAEASGQPNRLRVNYYRAIAQQLGYSYRIYVTSILGVPSELVPPRERTELGRDYSDSSLQMIREIRPRLAAQFRNLSDEDLFITGIFFIARKPG